MSEFDYIIVGSGSAGAVIADRLSQQTDLKVLVLEAGPEDTNEDFHTVTGFARQWGGPCDWKIQTTEQPGIGGRSLNISQGLVLGGSTSIHAMMFVRGSRYDYDLWNALGADGWSFADVLPHFRAIEDYEHGASEYRGAGGGLHVRKGYDPNALSEPFLNAAVELGFDGPYGDYNAADNTNVVGPLQFSITADDKRASSVQGFLNPARSRSNLTVLTEAPVTRVLFEGSRAVGVEYVKDGQTQTARATRETIISAGAFMSPKLLMLSGIGPAEHLKANNIAVQVDAPGVGQNLQDHLQLPVVYNTKGDIPPTKTLCGNILFTKTRSGMEMESPDLQMIFAPTVPIPLSAFLQFPNPVCIFIPILVRPFSRGEVLLRSSNPMDLPIVNPNYLTCAADVETLKSGVELVRQLAATNSFAPINAGEMAPGEGGDVEGYVRTQCTTIWHPAGTCKMGRDSLSVVDPQLRVYGVEGLRVADASIMPTVTAGNTNAPAAMIGHRAADFLLSS